MKIKYLKLKSWLLVALGGLVGINFSCDKHGFWEDDATGEYGTPRAHYHVKGTVTNEQGQPVAGIGVGERKQWNEEGGSQIMGYLDTTDSEGRYKVDYNYAFPRRPLSVDFHDIDGFDNGSYNDTMVTINTENVQLSGGDGHWYEGEATVIQNVVMTEKTNK
ncbi:MAG: radical SAM-associated putative lipoprotein [Bacteroidales bacterium]|nr:radical SAM-associated putative lipoprotein [Bacteroidales bacterium]